MNTKRFALALALALALFLAACGGAPSGSEGNAPESGPSGEDVLDPGTSGEDASEAPPSENGTSGEDAPGPGAPEEPASQEDVDLAGFYDALLSESEWPALMALEEELMDSFYPGLSDLSLKQCLVNTAAISSAVGEIALVEAETEEDAQSAATIFQARIDYQVGDETTPGGAWYPATIEGWQTTSHIAIQGNYVMLAVGENAAAAVERFQALFA